jgi:hypothetical protein
MRTVAAVLACVLPPLGVAADPAPATTAVRIEEAVVSFERVTANAFAPVEKRLEQWRTGRINAAIRDLSALIPTANADDKLFVAAQILTLNPRHKLCRTMFADAKRESPVDDSGKPVAGVVGPACSDRDLVAKIAALSYPPFDIVREVIGTKGGPVSGYWRTQEAELKTLKEKLLAIAGSAPNDAPQVYPILAYYHPELQDVAKYYRSIRKPVARQRVWFNPVDRYLLDHELAGVDCRTQKADAGLFPATKDATVAFSGSATWSFPEYLRDCRIEAVVSAPKRLEFVIGDGSRAGSHVVIDGGTVTIGGQGDRSGTADLSQPSLVHVAIHGRGIMVVIDGKPVVNGETAADCAYKRFTVKAANTDIAQLRVRYCSSLPVQTDQPPSTQDKPKEPWRAERERQLETATTFTFADNSMEDVAAILAQTTGIQFRFAASAEPLKNLPVTLAGTDMKLGAVIDWIHKLTDLGCEPDEKGFVFVWRK